LSSLVDEYEEVSVEESDEEYDFNDENNEAVENLLKDPNYTGGNYHKFSDKNLDTLPRFAGALDR
jgi:hypothetical protein